jgi:undecaprenyl-diphosphatase
MLKYIEILILALIQGAAELLPISSSAHVILAAKLMGRKPSSPDFVFLLVMLHTGTMFAVLYYFWPRWRWLLWGNPAASNEPPSGSRGHFVKMIVLATAITGLVGLALKWVIEKFLMRLLERDKAEVEELFDSLPLMAISLFAVGIFIIVAGWRNRQQGPPPPLREDKDGASTMTAWSATWIGLIQALCLPFRGFSRSGATISTALVCGVERSLAEEFSFALAVVLTPPVIGRALYRLLTAADDKTDLIDQLLPGLVGMVFSFAAGMLALKLLSTVLEKGHWQYFGYYCLIASLVVLSAGLAGY